MNPRIQTPSEILSHVQKPQLRTIDGVSLEREDWMIVCGGFEDRTLGALKSAIATGIPFNVLIIEYEPFIPQNRIEEIRDLCRKAGNSILEIPYNRQEPMGFGNRLLQSLPVNNGRVFIDISGMSRLLIVQVLVAFLTTPVGFSKASIVYAEAEEYPPSEKEATTILAQSDSDPTFTIFFLSSGVFNVTLLPELSSYAPAAMQTRLIAFPTLDTHQLIALRAELQPSRLSFIEGVPPAPHNAWRLKTIAAANCLKEIPNAEIYQTSTLFYDETLDLLLKLYEQHGIHERILVSPTGSKMQAVAVGITPAFVEDVQIVYPTPNDFLKPERYTHGVGPVHLLPIDNFRQARISL